MSEDIEFTAEVLRNKGVPIELATVMPIFPALASELSLAQMQQAGLSVDPIGFQRVATEDGGEAMHVRHLRFDVNDLADMEVEFGTLQNWRRAAAEQSIDATRRTLAIVFGGQPRAWGVAMLQDKLGDYAAAMGAAWALANGVDPQTAADALNRGAALLAAAAAVNQVAAEETLATAIPSESSTSPTPSGSEAG